MQGQALIDTIVAKAAQLTKPRRRFLAHILGLFLAIKGRLNFTQLARHSQHYCENTMRDQFSHHLDFASLNRQLIHTYGSGHFVLALDATFGVVNTFGVNPPRNVLTTPLSNLSIKLVAGIL